jgi:hypothetical protein
LEALFEILLERGTIWGAGEGYWPLRWGRRIMIIPIPNTNESSIEPVVTKTDGASINLMSVYWAPRGTRFVVNAYPGLILVTIAKEISMDWVPPGAPEAQLLLPLSWSEDGKRFLFVARRTVNGEWMDKLCEFDPETRRTSILFGSRSRVCSYCDSGKLVYVMKQDRPVYSRKLFVIELETKKERLLGENVESYYPKPFPRNNPWGLKGCTFLFTPSGKRGEPQELKVFLPESDSVKTLDRARFLAPCAFSPDERWAIYRRLEKPAPEEGTEFYSLYSANLATGKTHAIAKDGVNPNDRIAWPERTTLIFSKENKEIWSAAVDGSRLRRLYPEKTQ